MRHKTYKLRLHRAAQLPEKGDTNGAIRIPRRLATEFPNKAGAYPVIADTLWDKCKLAKAFKEFRATTKQFPKSKIASPGLFHTLWALSKTDAAFDEMKQFSVFRFVGTTRRW
jgi:hypothetical protein